MHNNLRHKTISSVGYFSLVIEPISPNKAMALVDYTAAYRSFSLKRKILKLRTYNKFPIFHNHIHVNVLANIYLVISDSYMKIFPIDKYDYFDHEYVCLEKNKKTKVIIEKK